MKKIQQGFFDLGFIEAVLSFVLSLAIITLIVYWIGSGIYSKLPANADEIQEITVLINKSNDHPFEDEFKKFVAQYSRSEITKDNYEQIKKEYGKLTLKETIDSSDPVFTQKSK